MASKESAAKDKKTREEKPSFYASLNEFLRRNRVVLIVLFSAVLAVLAVAAVWTLVESRVAASATKALETVEASLYEWKGMTEGSEYQGKADELIVELDGIAARFGKRYAAQKALVLAGRVYADRADWDSAGKKFLEAVERNSDSFLAGFALQEAARAAEERQDNEQAIALWSRVIAEYPDNVGLPHAYFVLGTLYEETKQYAEASDTYQKLVSAYPDNDWTKLARNRIILLKSQGLLP